MARPAKALPIPADDGFNPARLEEAGEAAKQLAVIQSQQEATVRAVAAQLGYQLPADCTDPDLIQRDIATNMRRTAEAMLQVGLGLLVLKEACRHGEFTARLEVLGFEPTVARRYMQVARKISNRATSRVLLNAVESQSKLLELIVLDDEQLEELELTGQTGELKLDDIATMSIKELRAALRESREKIADKDRVLIDKNTKINELDEQLTRAHRKLQLPPWDERVAPFQKEITERQSILDAAIGKHLEAIKALDVWLTGEITSAPDYDPETPIVLPPAIRAVVLHLDEAVSRTATLAAEMQRELRLRFGADIDEARQNVLVDAEV
jgi:hypothetical protein